MKGKDGISCTKAWTKAKLFICGGIRDLKRDKSTEFDNLMNEYLITGKAYLIPILGKLFNNIINTGIDPELWVQSIIIPVFKKGDVNEPGSGIVYKSAI
jgi:hypothetical protein